MKKGLTKIMSIVMGTVVIQFVLLFLYLAGSHMFQLALPRSYRYSYVSVEPSQDIYQTGETIYGSSTTIRKRPIETQRQDTMFCDNGERTKKYPTQYRPPMGYEIPKLGYNASDRKYSYQPNNKEIKCMLCGTVVAKTSYGYSKNYQYCTKWFGVNGNKVDSLAISNPEIILGY